MSWLARPLRAALAVIPVLVLAGCSATADDRAQESADAFYAAVRDRDGSAACRLLAPTTRDELEQSAEKPCAEAILEEDVPEATEAERVQVYDTMAQVRYAEDTVFLARIADSWRVLAVSCLPRAGEQPYDCAVKGG